MSRHASCPLHSQQHNLASAGRIANVLEELTSLGRRKIDKALDAELTIQLLWFPAALHFFGTVPRSNAIQITKHNLSCCHIALHATADVTPQQVQLF